MRQPRSGCVNNQRLPVEDGRQTFPRRKRGVGPAHADAELLHHVLDLSETLLIADGLISGPIEIELVTAQGEKSVGLILAHGIEENTFIDQLGFGRMTILAGIAMLLSNSAP